MSAAIVPVAPTGPASDADLATKLVERLVGTDIRLFDYEARTKSGELVTSTFSARSEQEALDLLRPRGIEVFYLEERSQRKQFMYDIDSLLDGLVGMTFMRPTRESLLDFWKNYSMQVSVGQPLYESLPILVDAAYDDRLKEILRGITVETNHQPLSAALSRRLWAFGSLPIAMVDASERSGQQRSAIIAQLVALLQSEADIRREFNEATADAKQNLLFLAGFMFYVAWFFLPQSISAFSDNAGGPPSYFIFLQTVFSVIANPVLLIATIVALFGGYLAMRRWERTTAGAIKLAQWRLKTPIFGRIRRLLIEGRFFRVYSRALASGQTSEQAMDIAIPATDNAFYMFRLAQNKGLIRTVTFSKVLEETGLFSRKALANLRSVESTSDRLIPERCEALGNEIETAARGDLRRASRPLNTYMTIFVAVMLLLIVVPSLLGSYSGLPGYGGTGAASTSSR